MHLVYTGLLLWQGMTLIAASLTVAGVVTVTRRLLRRGETIG